MLGEEGEDCKDTMGELLTSPVEYQVLPMADVEMSAI